jgi:hypothetical protein
MAEVYRVLKPGGRAVIGLYATYSTAFGLVHLRSAVRHVGQQARSRFMSAHTEHAWRTGGRVNPWTKTYSTTEIASVVRRHPVRELTFRANGNPIGEIPYFGRRLMRLSAMRRLDKALEPWFGSMLIASFTK